MRIFLIGFMGSGKSTVGKKLARQMKMDFIDLDVYIENQNRQTISTIFEQFGEEKFREMERNALTTMLEMENVVVATGGGTPCFFDNLEKIKKNGVSVYLEMNANALTKRLLHSKKERPLTKKLNEEELKLFIDKTLKERAPFYLQADLKIDGISVDVDVLMGQLNYSR